VQDLRPLAIEDLLDREPIQLDVEKIGGYLKGKTVLVTGAGGSIGSEICRQVLKLYPRQLILLGRGENSIYEINQELSQDCPPGVLHPVIINVACRESLERVFEVFHPQVVFHAAAHKHVPLMEHQPREAIYNNVVGSYNVAGLAGEYHVERFVLISTDKAVNPTSVMGATKRVTEMIMQALNKKYPDTTYVAVRFGNVLGSRGSVVPLFKKQIAAGGPVTVTDPEMKRYFMTIPEASQLVLEAAALGKGGEVFVLDMGKPVKILDLARNMIRLSGLEPDKDIKIKYTGLRPGEKLFEELLTAEEGTVATQNKKIYQAIIKDQDPAVLRPKLHELVRCMDTDQCIKLLQDIIPTYKPNHF
jgi:FlaA1/EpsC-like NDP-sugar epimerase